MKISEPRRPAASPVVGGVSRARGVTPAAPAGGAAPTAPANPGDQVKQTLRGIPAHELTERVREALVTLMSEVESLRRELDRSQQRILELEKLADTDTLSPIANRRAFVRELARVMSYAERYAVPTSLLFFDVNDLKIINDTYGHPGGDAALMHVADTLVSNVRVSDVVGRLGGDEYAVILTHATEEQAQVKADSLSKAIAERPAMFGDKMIPVSASVGVYSFGPGETPLDVLAKADAAMYRRKQARKAR